jgi:predicted AlkP superfamily phosphohydrolase/phosphomutase
VHPARRVAVIGIDAAEWSEVERLAASGLMPTLQRFLGTSLAAPLSGERPYRAESIWTEFCTGRPPADNRYWTTVVWDPTSYDTWEGGAYRGAPFYARPDLVPIVFDVPHSTIAPDALGLQMTGWGAHSAQYPTASRPTPLANEIDTRFGTGRVMSGDSHAGWHNPAYHAALAEGLRADAATRADIVSWLLDEEPGWELLITVFTEPHVAGHHFFHGVDERHPLAGHDSATTARSLYESTMAATDRAIGQILERLAPDVLPVVMAAHGMRANTSDVTGGVLVPELLFRQHAGRALIDFPPFDPADPPITLEPECSVADYLARFLTEPRGSMRRHSVVGDTLRSAVHRARRRSAHLVDAVEHAWWTATGQKERRRWWEVQPRPPTPAFTDAVGGPRLRPLDYQVPCWYRHHWPTMPIFALPSFSDAQLRVNLAGREASGSVGLDEYDRVLDATERLLAQTVDARTGRPIVEEVQRPRKGDPMDPDGPTADLVVSFEPVSDAIRHPDVGTIGAAPFMRTGEHSVNGFAAFGGQAASQAFVEGANRAADLAPTLLELLGKAPSPSHTGSSFAHELR